MSQHVIELNGKRYDAITGAYLGKSNVVPKHIVENFTKGKVIDGFVRPGSARVTGQRGPASNTEAAAKPAEKAAVKHEAPKPAPAAEKSAVKPAAKHVHAAASHLHPHSPERAKTLMKRAARKPEFGLKPAIKTQAPAEIMAKPKSALMHKPSAYGVDPLRHIRASQVSKHQAIRHFSPLLQSSAQHSVSHVPVLNVQPTPLTIARPTHVQPAHTDIFEAAIANARSHEQPAHKPRRKLSTRRKLVNSFAIVAAFLVIAGFVGYLNLPQLELRVASVQAGFGATMPAYSPTGYALEGGVKRQGGTVSLSFRSGDSRYVITQQSSNWNSQTLLDNMLALNGQHDAVQKDGLTIYIYDNGSNASWVNGNIRYDLNGNAQLTKDDITAIASSM